MKLATICARGGSKGVPGKNIRLLNGVPLIGRTIRQALASKCFDAIAVSSDSDEILAVARDFGVDLLIKRPEALASDTAAKIPVIRHCCLEAEERLGCHFDTITDLAVTSPLREIADIQGAHRLMESSGATNVVSVQEAPHSPYYNILERDASGRLVYSKALAHGIVRRQDAPACYAMNGAVYVWSREQLFADTIKAVALHTEIFVMSGINSIDIDAEVDFLVAECLVEKLGRTL